MKYRNIYKLVEGIKKEIPSDWDGKEVFLNGLDDVIDSANYRAPEAYSVNYDQLARCLGSCLGEADTKWKERIADIFADKIKIKGMDYFEFN